MMCFLCCFVRLEKANKCVVASSTDDERTIHVAVDERLCVPARPVKWGVPGGEGGGWVQFATGGRKTRCVRS